MCRNMDMSKDVERRCKICMFNLSVFAYIFVFLILIAFILVCIKEKRLSPVVIYTAIITFALVIGVGFLAVEYSCGEETIVTSIKIDDNNSSTKARLFMFFSDEQDNRYWGIGSISRVHYGGSIDIPVRITYLPKTKFVLGIERCVGNIPEISILGIENANREYTQIYSNGDSWSIACVFVLILIIAFSIPKISLKNFWS